MMSTKLIQNSLITGLNIDQILPIWQPLPKSLNCGIYRVASPKNGTVNFLGLCSDQQLFSSLLLDRASISHYNNTKIIKFG